MERKARYNLSYAIMRYFADRALPVQALWSAASLKKPGRTAKLYRRCSRMKRTYQPKKRQRSKVHKILITYTRMLMTKHVNNGLNE